MSICAQLAYDLDQQLGLGHDGNDYLNWGGWNEKWMTGTGEKWYFITEDGELYRWNGGALSAATLIDTLDGTYYGDTGKLHNAQQPANGGGVDNSRAQLAYELDQQLGLGHDGNDYLNWGGGVFT